MQTICSIYRLTHGPGDASGVLLDFGDKMAGELELPESQRVQAVNYPGAVSAGRFPRGNREGRAGFSRVVCFETNTQARLYALAAKANAPWGRRADLLVEFQDGSAARLTGAVLESLECELLTERHRACVVLHYEMACGATVLEDSAAFSAGNWEAQNATWEGWTEKFNHITGLLTTH